jgi:hypothetical protein
VQYYSTLYSVEGNVKGSVTCPFVLNNGAVFKEQKL